MNTVRSFIRQEFDEDTNCQTFQMMINQEGEENFQAVRRKLNNNKVYSCVSEEEPEANGVYKNSLSDLPEDSLRAKEPSFQELKNHFKRSRRSKNLADLSNLFKFDAEWSQM